MNGSAAVDRLVVQGRDIETPTLKALAKLAGAGRIDALSGSSDQAFALTPAGNADEVAAYCAQAALDCAIVDPGQHLDRLRLLAMDMDSTLITIECVDEIADMLGIKPEVAAITARAMRGEIDFRQSLTRRVALLAGLDVAALQRVYDERLRLSPGAERLLAGIGAVGAQSLLVSGGFTFFTERLRGRDRRRGERSADAGSGRRQHRLPCQAGCARPYDLCDRSLRPGRGPQSFRLTFARALGQRRAKKRDDVPDCEHGEHEPGQGGAGETAE